MILYVLACANSAPARVTSPSPWDFVADADTTVVVEAAQVQAGLEALTPWVWTMDPRAVWDETTRLVEQGDATCPAMTVQNGLALASGDCVASSGYGYYGFVQYTQVTDFYFWGREWTHDYRWQHGTLRVESPEGALYSAAGDLEFRDYDGDDGHRTWDAVLYGEYHWDTDVAWLAEDVGVLLDMEAHLGGAPSDGGSWVSLDGSLTRLPGDFDAVEYDAFVYPGVGCAEEPDGVVWLRHPLGSWYRVLFGGDCDGCGDVDLDGVPLGEACPDLASLREWGEDPWS